MRIDITPVTREEAQTLARVALQACVAVYGERPERAQVRFIDGDRFRFELNEANDAESNALRAAFGKALREVGLERFRVEDPTPAPTVTDSEPSAPTENEGAHGAPSPMTPSRPGPAAAAEPRPRADSGRSDSPAEVVTTVQRRPPMILGVTRPRRTAEDVAAAASVAPPADLVEEPMGQTEPALRVGRVVEGLPRWSPTPPMA